MKVRPRSVSLTSVQLSGDLLDLLADSKEVLIETRSTSAVTKTVIWVAVDGNAVYVRSVRGDEGCWYQRVKSDPDVVLVIDEYRIPFRAVEANDEASIESASRGFRRKYPKGESLDAMLRSEVLQTTLRLEPSR